MLHSLNGHQLKPHMLGHTNLGLDTGLFHATRNIIEQCWQADFVQCFAYSLHGGDLSAAEDEVFSVRPSS